MPSSESTAFCFLPPNAAAWKKSTHYESKLSEVVRSLQKGQSKPSFVEQPWDLVVPPDTPSARVQEGTPADIHRNQGIGRRATIARCLVRPLLRRAEGQRAMNLYYERRHVSWRMQMLQRLIDNLDSIKECDQCRAIVLKTTGMCPFCATYRFKEDAKRIRATLRVMGEVPWPRNAGFVPRLACESLKSVPAWQQPPKNRQEFEPSRKRKKRTGPKKAN